MHSRLHQGALSAPCGSDAQLRCMQATPQGEEPTPLQLHNNTRQQKENISTQQVRLTLVAHKVDLLVDARAVVLGRERHRRLELALGQLVARILILVIVLLSVSSKLLLCAFILLREIHDEMRGERLVKYTCSVPPLAAAPHRRGIRPRQQCSWPPSLRSYLQNRKTHMRHTRCMGQ